MKRFYFDYNATTPLAPAVALCLRKALRDDRKNPSSSHQEGRQARREIEKARLSFAHRLDCEPSEIIFTGGATEAVNLVFHSVWTKRAPQQNKIITTAVEHDAVLKPLERLERMGAEIMKLPVNRHGGINVSELKNQLDERALLVSVMTANNETGTLFPIDEIAKVTRDRGVLFHTDSAAAVGKIPLSFKNLGVDFLTLSGHKFHAPKGVGALIARRGLSLDPLVLGGMQEEGRRAGTENIFGILGMAKALEFVSENFEREKKRQEVLSVLIRESLKKFWPAVFFNQNGPDGLPATISATFPGVDNQVLTARLDLEGVAVATGSACHSGTVLASHVLLAMGLSSREAMQTLRISFGRMTTADEVKGMLKIFGRVLGEMK